ncbi:hypothetical protein, partial [Staphylococcus epidermidis]|uniref:hypothetical protein n=1 Tax=Staphylococcus epidermidis TaxID=1282 RepID=UPI001C92C7C3
RSSVPLTAGYCWCHFLGTGLVERYFSIGGTVGEYEVEAYVQGLLSLPTLQRDLLAMAANELINAVPRLRAPYAKDLTESSGTTH